MIILVAFDWDKDGDFDLIVGDEDGRVALVEHDGKIIDGLPQFLPPAYFQQEATEVEFGALATPCGFDWDGDGDDDIICGNTAGYIALIESLGGFPPKWAAPKKLKAGGEIIRIQAGPNGSIQGPCEAKWGYTTQTGGDWDQDGLPDIVANSIWGKVVGIAMSVQGRSHDLRRRSPSKSRVKALRPSRPGIGGTRKGTRSSHSGERLPWLSISMATN